MKVMIVPNLNKQHTVPVAQRAAAILQAHGAVVYLADGIRFACPIDRAVYLPAALCRQTVDVVLTVGGDGTILHQAQHLLESCTPILGINVGRCGFLATCEESQMEEKLTRLAQGEYELEARMLLNAETSFGWQGTALNDIVISRGTRQNAVEFLLYCDSILVEHYRGDGIILATPTGSTAYSLAAGGPILDAKTKGIVATPICAHALESRSIVFAQERQLHVEIGQQDDCEIFISCDGQEGVALHTGDVVTVCHTGKMLQLVTFGSAEQFDAIDRKLKGRY